MLNDVVLLLSIFAPAAFLSWYGLGVAWETWGRQVQSALGISPSEVESGAATPGPEELEARSAGYSPDQRTADQIEEAKIKGAAA